MGLVIIKGRVGVKVKVKVKVEVNYLGNDGHT